MPQLVKLHAHIDEPKTCFCQEWYLLGLHSTTNNTWIAKGVQNFFVCKQFQGLKFPLSIKVWKREKFFWIRNLIKWQRMTFTMICIFCLNAFSNFSLCLGNLRNDESKSTRTFIIPFNNVVTEAPRPEGTIMWWSVSLHVVMIGWQCPPSLSWHGFFG